MRDHNFSSDKGGHDIEINERRTITRRGGLMVSALACRSSSPGSSPGRGHCVVLLGKTLTLKVPLSTRVCNAAGNLVMDQHPIQGGVETLLVTSCY